MTQDRLGEFLYRQGVPPDNFPEMRADAHNDDMAIVKLNESGWRYCYFADKNGKLTGKLISYLALISAQRLDFEVVFSNREPNHAAADLEGLYSNDPDQLELFTATVVYDQEAEPEGDEPYDGTNSWEPPILTINFTSYEGILLSNQNNPSCPQDETLFGH